MAHPILSTLYPAYHIVNYEGVPIYRAQAWALKDAAIHGQEFTVTSGDRRPSTISAFNKKYHTNLHDQAYLYRHQHDPGFFPANPPDRGTHVLKGDGVVGYLHEDLPKYKLGIDVVSKGYYNNAAPLVMWLNQHGYSVYRPYPSGSEAHHIVFRKSPATNARKRLAAHYAGRPHKR